MKRKADQDRYIREYHKKLYMTDPKLKRNTNVKSVADGRPNVITFHMISPIALQILYGFVKHVM